MCRSNEEPPRDRLRLFITVIMVIIAVKTDTVTADVMCVICLIYVLADDLRHR